MLHRALELDPSFADSLCTPAAIRALSEFLAAAEHPLATQAAAARVLAVIAALPAKKQDASEALVDFTMPRACEVMHQAAAGHAPTAADAAAKEGNGALQKQQEWGGSGGEGKDSTPVAQLRGSCAALVAQLASASRLCCHVILFHTGESSTSTIC